MTRQAVVHNDEVRSGHAEIFLEPVGAYNAGQVLGKTVENSVVNRNLCLGEARSGRKQSRNPTRIGTRRFTTKREVLLSFGMKRAVCMAGN